MRAVFFWGLVNDEIHEELERELEKDKAPKTTISPLEGVF